MFYCLFTRITDPKKVCVLSAGLWGSLERCVRLSRPWHEFRRNKNEVFIFQNQNFSSCESGVHVIISDDLFHKMQPGQVCVHVCVFVCVRVTCSGQH